MVDVPTSADLASTDSGKGATLVGFSHGQQYAAETVSGKLKGTLAVKDAPFNAVGDRIADDSGAVQTALDFQDTATAGSFQLSFPDGQYRLGGAGDGDRIVAIQTATALLGSSLEGTFLGADTTADVDAMVEDQGSAAKIEIRNLTLYGNNNPNLTAGLRLGMRTVQFGTYGFLDNLMVRNMPNATAYDLNVNVQASGDLYSVTTRDGLVTRDGGVGFQAKGVYPYEWTRYGIKFGGIGDSVLNGEHEAPLSDDALVAFFSRGGVLGLGAHVVSLQPARVIKTVFGYDPQIVAGARIATWDLLRVNDSARFGDVDNPAYGGTSASVGLNTLTDPALDLQRDELMGGALFITSGPAAGDWYEIAGNTKDTITVVNSAWETSPGSGATFALDYACKAGTEIDDVFVPNGDGHRSSHDLTLPTAAILRLSTERHTSNESVVGSSNDARRMTQRLATITALDFASVPANSVGTQLSATVHMADLGDAVCVTPPVSAAAQGIIYDGVVTAAGTVTIYPKNLTGAAVDPASGDFTIEVRKYG